MKNFFKISSMGRSIWSAFVLLLLFWHGRTQAQTLAATPAYGIKGPETGEVGADHASLFERTLPDGGRTAYWRVKGARTVNGKPANILDPWDLDATKITSIMVEWDSIPASTGQGLVALVCQQEPTKESDTEVEGPSQEAKVDTVASMRIFIKCPPCLPDFGLCAPKIYYLGLASGQAVSTELTEYTYVCSDVNTTGSDPRQRYSARWACAGPLLVVGYSYPFTILWNVEYFTESGAVYQENWGATRYPYLGFDADIKYLDVTWYDVVPTTSYAGLSTGLVPLGTSSPNALAGQKIVRARLTYTGFSCGTGGYCGPQKKSVDVYYETPATASIQAWAGPPSGVVSIAESGMLPCRTGIYTLECADVREATQYAWTTSLGTVSGTGRTVTLDLSQVSGPATDVVVTVAANNPAAPCGQQGRPRQATFYFPPAANAPSTISIDGVALTCPGLNQRTLSVPPAGNGVSYVWSLTGNTANLRSQSTGGTYPIPTPPIGNTVLIEFNGPGRVDVDVTAVSACGYYTPLATATYSPAAGSTPAALPTQNPFSDNTLWQYQSAVRLTLNTYQAGVSYSFGPVTGVRTFTTWPGASPTTPTQSAPSNLVTVVPGPNGAAYVNLTLNAPDVASFSLQVQARDGCSGTVGTPQVVTQTRPFHGYYRNGAGPAAPGADEEQATLAPAAELYPNPAGDVVYVAPADAATHYEWVRVLDTQGQLVREVRAEAGQTITQVVLAGLPPGLYAVQLYDGQRCLTRHLAKQ